MRPWSPIDNHPPALLAQLLEGVDEIAVELHTLGEAVERDHLHVVGIEAVGHDQLPAGVIGQVVGIAVGIVDEPAFRRDQPRGVRRGPALVPAERAAAGQARVERDRFGDVCALGLLGTF